MLLRQVLRGELAIAVSTPLLLEYEAVLTRPANLARAGLEALDVRAVLDALVGRAVRVHFDFRHRPVARDPNDDFVIETAINGGADTIVTFNMADMLSGAMRFGIKVVKPGEMLKEMRS
jgi:predicted nucleic acid-binding protein